jgi:hypothetical protein
MHTQRDGVVQIGFGLLDRFLGKLRFLIVRTRFEPPASQPVAGASVPGYKLPCHFSTLR